MSELRIQFENAFPVPAHWIEFDEKRNKYYCPYVADAKAHEYQAQWEVWQSRQSEIDQLKAEKEKLEIKLSETKQVYRNVVDMELAKVEKLKAEKVGLEKRIDEITHLATELAEYASYAEIVGAVTHNRSAVRKYCDEIFDFNRKVDAELEQALRGEHE